MANIKKLKEIRRQVVELDGDINPKFRMKQLLDALIEEPKENWEPKKKGMYFFIESHGRVDDFFWDGGEIDKVYLSFGNVFKTREEAEEASKKIKELLNNL